MQKILIKLQPMQQYLENSIEFKLDSQWNRKALGQRAGDKGIYILFTQIPNRIIYVGKTRGATMDFATRLYRHATKSASQNSKVYRKLKECQETGQAIKVSLLTSSQVKIHFDTKNLNLTESAMIDILEQVLIHYLQPEIQDTSDA